MNDAGGRQPHGDEYGHELGEPYGARRFEDVEVLEDVGDRHQSQRTEEP